MQNLQRSFLISKICSEGYNKKLFINTFLNVEKIFKISKLLLCFFNWSSELMILYNTVVGIYINTITTIFTFKFCFLTFFFQITRLQSTLKESANSPFLYFFFYVYPKRLVEIKNWDIKSSSLYWFIWQLIKMKKCFRI